jgi:hypothetical protein
LCYPVMCHVTWLENILEKELTWKNQTKWAMLARSNDSWLRLRLCVLRPQKGQVAWRAKRLKQISTLW